MEKESEFISGLYKKTIHELRIMGREVGVYAPATLKKDELINQIRAIVFGTQMPTNSKSKKPLKELGKTDFEEKQKIFFQNVEDELPINKNDKFKLNAASPIIPIKYDIDEKIKDIDLNGIDEDEIAVVYIGKNEAFVLDTKTNSKLPIGFDLIEKYQLVDGDFIFGDVCGDKCGFFDIDIKWINGYWIKKEDVDHKFINSPYFNLGKDNYGYSRLVSLFAPIVRGQSNLIFTQSQETEDQIIKELCADIKANYKTANVRAVLLDLGSECKKEMNMIIGGAVCEIKGPLKQENQENFENFLSRVCQYFKADGEVVLVIRNIQNLYEKFYKRCENKELSIEYIKTILGYAKLNTNKNALTVVASIVADCDASCDLYANVCDVFGSEFFMVEDDNSEYEICDIERCRTQTQLLNPKHCEFIKKQQANVREQGLLKTNKEIFKKINSTNLNEKMF